MSDIFDYNQRLVKGFERVLSCLPEGETYNDKPPKRTENLPNLSKEELEAIRLNEVGESSNSNRINYRAEDIDFHIEGLTPRTVQFPTSAELDGVELFGIDGSNQRIDNPCFHFLLARAAIVNFRYTKGLDKPYFYTKMRDASAVIQVDGNIFTNRVRGRTYDDLFSLTQDGKKAKQERISIYDHLEMNEDQRPFLLGYDHNAREKSPSAHALGWGVKFMNVLELMCLEDIPKDRKLVCIKDGPLFSSSSTQKDNLQGLKNTKSWDEGILISVSKRITENRLFLDLLSQFPSIVDHYFKNQNITSETINAIGTDSLLLQRILKPGQRTSLIKAIPYNRAKYVKGEGGDPKMFPLVCYYMRKTKPHNIIRLEIPIFMYQASPEAVERAISLVAWQLELGVKAPLVQMAADERCQLGHEHKLLTRQTLSMIDKRNIQIPASY